jgi:hypothetical protein
MRVGSVVEGQSGNWTEDTELRKCTGSCGPDGTGRILPLTEEYFLRRRGRRYDSVIWTARCRACRRQDDIRNKLAMKQRRASHSALLKLWSTAAEPLPRPEPPPRQPGESLTSYSERIVDQFLVRFPWEISDKAA